MELGEGGSEMREQILEFDGEGGTRNYKSQLNGAVPGDRRYEFPPDAVD